MKAAGAWLAAALAAVLLGATATAAASPPPLASAFCAPDRGALVDLRDEIAAARTLAEAQQLATPPVQLARSALARARWRAPGSTGLAEKEQQLREGERAIAAAATPDAVAGAFAAAVTGSPVLADIDVDPPNCSYSTLEIIAIVLGFILGIIPGIILLIILC